MKFLSCLHFINFNCASFNMFFFFWQVCVCLVIEKNSASYVCSRRRRKNFNLNRFAGRMRNLSQRALFLFALALANDLHTPMNTHTAIRSYAHTHARTHARTHTHTHTHSRTIRVTQTCTGHVACLPASQSVSV